MVGVFMMFVSIKSFIFNGELWKVGGVLWIEYLEYYNGCCTGWLSVTKKMKEIELDKWKWLIWALWKEYLELFDFDFAYSYDQLLHFKRGLEYDQLSMFMRVFAIIGEFLVVDQMYRSCDCSFDMVTYLGSDHIRYDILVFSWSSWSILVISHS